MIIKEGADIKGLHFKMRKVLIACEIVWKNFGQEFCITSGLDGTHSAGSLHYYGRAIDARTRYWGKSTQHNVRRGLEQALGEDYDVVVEKRHMHIEYDKKTY